MVETIIAGLVVAFISSITYVALKYPKTYTVFYFVILAILFFVITFIVGYNMALTSVRLSLVQNDSIMQVREIVESKEISRWYFLVFLIVNFYLLFLTYLPKIFNYFDSKENYAPKKPSDKEE